MQHQTQAGQRAFVMLNAHLFDPSTSDVENVGHYDPVTQTWIGRINAMGKTYSDRSTVNGTASSVARRAADEPPCSVTSFR